MTPERIKEVCDLANQVSLLVGGHPLEVSIAALTDCLTGVIAIAATDREHAIEFTRAVTTDMAISVIKHWDYYRAQKTHHVNQSTARS